MFIIKSNVNQDFEVQTSLAKAHSFFSNQPNYADFMPNLESIHTDGQGIIRWNIAVEVPFVGKWKMPFAVDLLMSDEIIEWIPSSIEKHNFLRCVIYFTEKSENLVKAKISHNIELRRNKATELHPLANLAGENLISSQMELEVGKMLKTFIKKAKEKLEI
jgi:hypothetical protein